MIRKHRIPITGIKRPMPVRSFYLAQPPRVGLHTSLKSDGRRMVWLRLTAPGVPSYLAQLDHDAALELARELVLAAEPWRREDAA